MPPKSRRPPRPTKSNKTKGHLLPRSSSPIDQSPDTSVDDQDMEDLSSDEEAPRLDPHPPFALHSLDIDLKDQEWSSTLNMKNLLKSLENQSKQNLAKKQTKTFQEIQALLQDVLVARLNTIIQSQESELEGMVSGYFTFKVQIEGQKEKLIDEIIKQQQSLQNALKVLEDNLEEHIENVEGKLGSTMQLISQLDRPGKLKPVTPTLATLFCATPSASFITPTFI
ncbi:uncharacterized protein VP01_107g8 [Puccinia sorghi]|uniref:Uncharacterized protein n=1 Tax=Puccinia sorghi TaxID=27349 RepID=A0A0L6VTE8_9BASI|nr:uncharacterized protein VP01_107g8 [Puccinia sorghi]